MTSVFADGALHPGRDANDSAWLVLRDALDWAGATLTDVVLDASLPALMLAPAGLADDVPLAGEATAADGTMYRSEPDNHRVLWRRPCDAQWSVLVGGPGTETGRVRRPLGLALDPRRGLLAIADADNHRVQIVRADGGEPVVVLGCIDAWGRGVAPGPGADSHALAEPVGVAFGRGWLAIADRAGGVVHVYDDRFRFVGAFAPSPPGTPAAFTAAPVAVAITGCIVWVVDAGWSIAVPYGVTGEVVDDAGPPPAELAAWLAHARFVARGDVVRGPIDGRTEGLAWHRVIVDAAMLAGTAVEVQTFASDDPSAPIAIPWAPARPIRIPLAGVESTDGEADRPVLSDQGRWQRSRGEPYLRIGKPIARLDGTGPVNSAGFTVPWPAARRLREGDVIELAVPGGPTVTRPILGITGRVVQAVVHDDLVAYGVPASLTLIVRDGDAPLGGPRLIRALAGGDSIDLTGATDDGTLYDLPASHGIAALLRDGDVARLDNAPDASTVVVHTIDAADATIVLAAPVVGDFSTADLRIVTAEDRLIVDELDWTDGVPEDEPVFVHDDVAGTQVTAAVRWVEVELGAVWLEPGAPVPWSTWTRFTLPQPVATDRGRYLWLRLRLLGALPDPTAAEAIATPVIRSVRLLLPRPSYLRYLPAVYARRDDDDPSGALFLERLLALPEHELTGIEATYEQVARQLNPLAASPDWLAFVATWFGLVFDPSWPIERRRRLLVSAHELFAKRGTLDGLKRYLEIYTGTAPAIVEGFQYRIVAAPTTTLGGAVVLGRAALGEPVTGPSTGLAHWFSIWVFGDDAACGAELTAKAARAIIDSVKPAHTTYDLHVVDGAPRVGITTMVGVDTVLIGGERPPPPLGLAPRPPHVLGRSHLPAPARATAAATLAPIPLDDDFTLS